MKSKLNFFGVCVLTCALVLSLFSCTKDLQTQIDKLTTDVVALQSAINSGKLVKQVTPVAGGYDIVFSDNNTIRINHGTNGTPGAPGAAGFTPIIGIDVDGYWTVVKTQGGDPVRIKNAAGADVKAGSADNFTLVDSYLAVNGVKTTVYIPSIAYNATTRTLMIWASNGDGTSTMYNVPLANEIVLTTDIIGLVSPIGNTKVLLQYGSVPATGNVAAVLTWAGVTAGQALGSNGVLPVIVNPSAAAISGYTFEIVKADGTLYALQGTISQGFDITKTFSQYVSPPAGGSNALYSITLNPTLAEINAHVGTTSTDKETIELAIRATKGTREIYSGFQYSINVKKAIQQVLEPAAGIVKYVPTGKSIDVVPMFFKEVGLTNKQSAANFYKVGLAYATAPVTNPDIKPYITLSDASSIVSTTVGNHTVANLDGRSAYFTLMSFDFVGKYETRAVEFKYFTDLTASVPDAAAINHTLTSTVADQSVTINLDPMFVALDAVGKTALWRANASGLELSVKIGTTTYTGAAALLGKGIKYEFMQLDGTTAAVGATDIRKIKFTFDPAVAMPGSYSLKFQFADSRIGTSIPNTPENVAAFGKFTFNIPVTIANPSALPSNVASMLVHTAGLWVGNDLSVFGPSTGQLTNSVRYDLTGAYALALGTEFTAGRVKFIPTVAADVTATLITADQSYLVQKDPLAPTSYATLYTPKQVVLKYFWFNNPSNSVILETINVTAKSEIVEGKMETKMTTVAPIVPKVLVLTHGVSAVKNFSDYFLFKHYFGTDMDIFSGFPNARVASVSVTVAPEYDNLVVITAASGAPYTIDSKTSPLTPITGDVVVPVTVKVTDKFGLSFTGTVNVTVKKP